MDEFISGGISGAITDPYSDKAEAHAKRFYEFIRKTNSDIEKITNNTEWNFSQILLVKNYLFINSHDLDGDIRLFDPCFQIAESWRRLAFDPEHIQTHDLTLIRHELLEMELISKGYTQTAAHNETELRFNYNKESDKFYNKLKPRGNSLHRSGGMNFRTH